MKIQPQPFYDITDRSQHNNVISGTAKVCDKKTGKCMTIEDGKPGETPPIKKTKEKTKAK